MIKLKNRTYNNNNKLFLRSAVSLLLIFFVLLKPVYAFTHTVTEDQKNYSCIDFDDKESDDKESDDKDSNEKETEKEGFEDNDEKEDNLAVIYSILHNASSQKYYVIVEQHYSNEFHLGVISPPPEQM